MPPLLALTQAWTAAEAAPQIGNVLRRATPTARHLGFGLVLPVLSACATEVAPPTPTPADASEPPVAIATETASWPPTAAPTRAGLHVNEAGGWSIVLPPGWEVEAQNGTGTSFTGPQVGEIAESLVFID
jgi:hypothetical protein